MPFTPLHFGPGMTLKAIVPRHFSICVFVISQVVIDLEVLWYMIWWEPPLHRFWHTYLGATIVAGVCFALGKPVSQLVKVTWNRIARLCTDANLSVPVATTWLASLTGAVSGAYSHVFLDSITHSHAEPMQPFSAGNPVSGIISPMLLWALCVLLGVAGILAYVWRQGWPKG